MPTIDITRIADNIGALSSLQSLLDVNNKLSAAQQKLSTGKQINSAEDDPAGLVIATKLNARSQGLKVAMNNISDAKNMMSVAEAGLSQITSILTQMRNKATQAASDTLGGTERATIQTQLSQFAHQINDIVTQTKWNGVQLLSGNLSKVFQTGVETGETTTWSLAVKHDPTSLGVSSSVQNAVTNLSGAGGAITASTPTTVFSGVTQLSTGSYNVAFDAAAVDDTTGGISNVNNQMTATGGTAFGFVATSGAGGVGQLNNGQNTLNIVGLAGSVLSYQWNGTGAVLTANFGTSITGASGSVGLASNTGSDSGIALWMNGANSTTAGFTGMTGAYTFDYVQKGTAKMELQYQDGTAVSVDADGVGTTAGLSSSFYVAHGATYNTGKGISITAGTTANMAAAATAGTNASFSYTAQNAYSVDVSSAAKASAYMSTLDNAADTVNQSMADLGSLMARMDIKTATASSAQINIESAYNTIMNANMAEQQVNASKYQVLQQTAVAMLAQSNQAPQAILSLFK